MVSHANKIQTNKGEKKMTEDQIKKVVKTKGQCVIAGHIIKLKKDLLGGGFATMITYNLIKPNKEIIHVLTIKEALEKIKKEEKNA